MIKYILCHIISMVTTKRVNISYKYYFEKWGHSYKLGVSVSVTNPYLYFKLYYNSGTEFGFAGECKTSLPFEFPTRTMVLFCINYDEVKGLFCEILTLRYIKP